MYNLWLLGATEVYNINKNLGLPLSKQIAKPDATGAWQYHNSLKVILANHT